MVEFAFDGRGDRFLKGFNRDCIEGSLAVGLLRNSGCDSVGHVSSPRGGQYLPVVNFCELIKVGDIGFISGIIVGQEIYELQSRMHEGNVSLTCFFDDSQAGAYQVQ